MTKVMARSLQAHDQDPIDKTEWCGHPIAVEVKAGDRRYVGTPLEVEIPKGISYGYFDEWTASDGDSLDVILGPKFRPTWKRDVYVATQRHRGTGAFQQYKVLLGFPSAGEAKRAFLALWPKEMYGGIWTMPSDVFEKTILPKIGEPKVGTEKQAAVGAGDPLANLKKIYELEYKWSKLAYERKRGPLPDRAERLLYVWSAELNRRLDDELALFQRVYAEWLKRHKGDEVSFEANYKLLDPVLRMIERTRPRHYWDVIREVQESGDNNARTFDELKERIPEIAPFLDEVERGLHQRPRTQTLYRVSAAASEVAAAKGLPLNQKIVAFHKALTTAHNNGAMSEWIYLADTSDEDTNDLNAQLTALSEMKPPPQWDEEVSRLLSLPRGGGLKEAASVRYETSLDSGTVHLSDLSIGDRVRLLRDVVDGQSKVVKDQTAEVVSVEPSGPYVTLKADLVKPRKDGRVTVYQGEIKVQVTDIALLMDSKDDRISKAGAMLDVPPRMFEEAKKDLEIAVKYFARKKAEENLKIHQDLPKAIEQAEAELGTLAEQIRGMGSNDVLSIDVPRFGAAAKPRVLRVWRRGDWMSNPNKYHVYIEEGGQKHPEIEIDKAIDLDEVITLARTRLYYEIRNAKRVADTLTPEELTEQQEFIQSMGAGKPPKIGSSERGEYAEFKLPVDLTGWRYEGEVDKSKMPSEISLAIYPWTHPEQVGRWHEFIGTAIWTGEPFPTPEGIRLTLRRATSTLEHELAHGAQTFLSLGKGLVSKDEEGKTTTIPGGLPSRKGPWDLIQQQYRQPHERRDIEFYPNLVTELRAFEEKANRMGITGPESRADYARQWVNESRRFKSLKEFDEQRWRKAVTEFMRVALGETRTAVDKLGTRTLQGDDANGTRKRRAQDATSQGGEGRLVVDRTLSWSRRSLWPRRLAGGSHTTVTRGNRVLVGSPKWRK